MTKQEAITLMIAKIEEIEKGRLRAHLSIDATKQKKEAVEAILKALKELEVEDENQPD